MEETTKFILSTHVLNNLSSALQITYASFYIKCFLFVKWQRPPKLMDKYFALNYILYSFGINTTTIDMIKK